MWDIFICHVQEDRIEFAQPLALAMQRAGLRVKSDTTEISSRDGLQEIIDRGLAQSRYGVVIVSQNYIENTWAKKGLIEFSGQAQDLNNIILIVCHPSKQQDILEILQESKSCLTVLFDNGIEGLVQDLLRLIPDFSHSQVDIPIRDFSFNKVSVDALGVIIAQGRGTVKKYVEDLGQGILLEMISIPGGTYLMGAPVTEEQGEYFERPQHLVTLSPFFMGRYPITQEQWDLFMRYNPSHFSGPKRPVENISWQMAQEFLEKLNTKLRWDIYRLPTEAEWEYGCRAGTTSVFSFGDTITQKLVNYDANYPNGDTVDTNGLFPNQTTDVGSYPPNRFGLSDMHGNVWEWCQDWYDSYSDESVIDPIGSDDELVKVVRGGCWMVQAKRCRSAYRSFRGPRDRYGYYGFRVSTTRQMQGSRRRFRDIPVES